MTKYRKAGLYFTALTLFVLAALSWNCNRQSERDLISTLNHSWNEKRAAVDARLSKLPVGKKGKFGVYREGSIFNADYRTLYLSFDSLSGLDFYVFDIASVEGLEERLKDSVTRVLAAAPHDSVLSNGVRVSKWNSRSCLCELRAGERRIFITGRPNRH